MAWDFGLGFLLWILVLDFGFVGFLDDYIKVKAKNSDGLSSKQKIILQTLFASIASAYLYFSAETSPETARRNIQLFDHRPPCQRRS